MECALAYRKVNESVNYIWPNRNFVMVCARPTKIERDGRGRLHSLTGMAIQYPDGWGLYMIHGVKFDKVWWEKIASGKMSPDEVFSIDNVEHRRIAYECMDKTKMKSLKDFKVLDEVKDDGYGHPMKVISFTVQNMKEPLKFFNCFDNSTDREYFLGTDKDKCSEAKASLIGLSDDEVEWVKEY